MNRALLFLLTTFSLLAQQTVNNFTVKTNLTVLGSASITNTSIYGATMVDTGNALQNTVDYSLALTPNGDTATSNDATPRPQSVATIASLVSDVDPLLVPTYARVSVLGYATAGDGGGGEFRRVLYSSVSGTEGEGGIWFWSSNNVAYAWERVKGGELINVKWFGAKGDFSTDDTDAIQSAIDYAQSTADKPVVSFPEGRYVVSSLVSTNVSLQSEGGKNSNGGDRDDYSSAATLIHKVGATNDLLTLRVYQNPAPSIRRLNFIGAREQNRKNTCAITAVTDRLNFTVATNNLPAAPSSPTTWPYYGYCFFFSNEGRYIGSGQVTNINYTTGAIELVPETDQYATLTSASYLLSTGFEVSFAETTTEAGYVTNTGVDSSKAGYNAINITATRSNLISEVTFDDIKIDGFHTGIRLGNQLFTYMNRVWANSCSFASVAVAFPGQSRDGVSAGLFLQGFYRTGDITWPSAETNTWDNAAYRATLFGWYGMEASAAIDDVRIDHTVHGIYSQNVIETQINQLLTDSTVSHAIMIGGSAYADSRVNMEIGELQIRNVNTALYTATTTNPSYAIKSWGQNNQNLIHGMSVVEFGSNRYFDAVFDVTGSNNRLTVDNLFTAAGATNSTLYSASSTAYPIINAYTETANQIHTHVAGAQRMRLDSTTLTSSNNIYGAGTIQSGGNMIVGNNKTTFSATSGTVMDAIGISMRLGADQSNANARTDATTKRAVFFVPNYNNSDAGMQVFNAFTTSTGNDLYLGGGDGTLQPATSIRFMIGTKAAGAGTEVGRFSSSGLELGNATDTTLARSAPGVVTIEGNTVITSTTIKSGTGSPEGAVTATVGTIFLRTDGGAGTTLYVKESGTGNTGWVGK